MDTPYAIEMLHITKRFPGIIANDDITLQVKKGEIHALLGENGAGKSTLMSVLFGLYQPEAGEIRKNGEKVNITDPNVATALGIGMVHQHFQLVDVFTVLDNIILGAETTKMGFVQKKEARKKVEELSQRYGLRVDVDAKVEDITVGMQQRVEILKVLYRGADILILDEPTAGLDPKERINFRNMLAELSKDKIILLATHIVSDIECIADEVILLKKGNLVKKDTPEALMKSVSDKVFEIRGTKEELLALQHNVGLGNIIHDQNGISLRIVTDKPHYSYIPVKDNISLEDVYLYYFEYLK